MFWEAFATWHITSLERDMRTWMDCGVDPREREVEAGTLQCRGVVGMSLKNQPWRGLWRGCWLAQGRAAVPWAAPEKREDIGTSMIII